MALYQTAKDAAYDLAAQACDGAASALAIARHKWSKYKPTTLLGWTVSWILARVDGGPRTEPRLSVGGATHRLKRS